MFVGQLVSAGTGFRFIFALTFLGLAGSLLLADRQRQVGMIVIPRYLWNALRGRRETEATR